MRTLDVSVMAAETSAFKSELSPSPLRWELNSNCPYLQPIFASGYRFKST